MNPRHDDSYDEHLREGVSHLSEVGLSDGARARIRSSVAAFTRENPVAEGVSPRRFGFPGIESPWASELLSMEMVTRPALASVLVALLVGSTISYAAELALPGDPLYWVKTDVSESVADIITVSDAAQVEWDARKVERRLEEALALAAADRLDGEARNQIEAGLERGIAEFSEHVGAVLNEDPILASAVKAELEVTLRAHQEVLDGLGGKDADDGVVALADRARALADAVAADRAALDAALAEDVAFLEVAASAKADVASREVEIARRALARVHARADVDSATEADVSARLSLSAESYAAGDAAAEAGNYPAAFGEYQDAHRFAKEARLLTLTGARGNGGKNADAEDDGEKGKNKNGGDEDEAAVPDEGESPESGSDGGQNDAAGAKESGEAEVRADAEVDSGTGVKAGVGNLNLL